MTKVPPGHVTSPIKIKNITSLKKTQRFRVESSCKHVSEPILAVSNGLNLNEVFILTIQSVPEYVLYAKKYLIFQIIVW